MSRKQEGSVAACTPSIRTKTSLPLSLPTPTAPLYFRPLKLADFTGSPEGPLRMSLASRKPKLALNCPSLPNCICVYDLIPDSCTTQLTVKNGIARLLLLTPAGTILSTQHGVLDLLSPHCDVSINEGSIKLLRKNVKGFLEGMDPTILWHSQNTRDGRVF
jgi:hypothetical protein